MSADSVDEGLVQPLQDLAIEDQETKPSIGSEDVFQNVDCAICWNQIALRETALIKGCEHAYCVTCILRWASCKSEQNKEVTCPMCKIPFKFLNIHRALDGSINDYLHEESICLLLRASWFNPLVVVEREEIDIETENSYYQGVEEDFDDEFYLNRSSIRIGNRRFGDNGYVRAGRQEARPAHRPNLHNSCTAGTSQQEHNKAGNQAVGRRAKRALKRQAADKGLLPGQRGG